LLLCQHFVVQQIISHERLGAVASEYEQRFAVGLREDDMVVGEIRHGGDAAMIGDAPGKAAAECGNRRKDDQSHSCDECHARHSARPRQRIYSCA